MTGRVHQPRLLAELPAPERRPLSAVSVTSLVTYARCPRQCYWTVVEPRPRRASTAARVGSVLHAWIDRQASAQASLLPVDGDADVGRLGELKSAFLASPYASLRPLVTERPFALYADGDGIVVRGRVDAVYERDGRIEIVDFKTGRRPAADDGGAGLQLDVYALAAVDCWGHEPSSVRTTEWYLRADEGTSVDFDAERLERVRTRVNRALDELRAERYGAVPGSYCERCDFARFCRPGRAYLDGDGPPGARPVVPVRPSP